METEIGFLYDNIVSHVRIYFIEKLLLHFVQKLNALIFLEANPYPRLKFYFMILVKRRKTHPNITRHSN